MDSYLDKETLSRPISSLQECYSVKRNNRDSVMIGDSMIVSKKSVGLFHLLLSNMNSSDIHNGSINLDNYVVLYDIKIRDIPSAWEYYSQMDNDQLQLVIITDKPSITEPTSKGIVSLNFMQELII